MNSELLHERLLAEWEKMTVDQCYEMSPDSFTDTTRFEIVSSAGRYTTSDECVKWACWILDYAPEEIRLAVIMSALSPMPGFDINDIIRMFRKWYVNGHDDDLFNLYVESRMHNAQ